MVMSETETVAYDKNHAQELGHSSPSLPLPPLLPDLALQESPISPPSNHQNSIFSLTLDEIQSKSGRMFGSMSMDEFLANIWNFDYNQIDSPPPPPPRPPPPTIPPPPLPPTPAATHGQSAVQNKNAGAATDPSVSQPSSISVPPPICKKTVNEVWSEIQKDRKPQKKEANGPIRGNESLRKQQALREMTLEDFLIKAGVVQESSLPSSPLKSPSPQQRPSSSLPIQNQTGNMANNRPLDASNKMVSATRVGISTLAVSQSHSLAVKDPTSSSAVKKCQKSTEPSRNSSRKRIIDGPPEVLVERRQRRMLKNRESAARSRARKQAYTVELEAGLSQLRQENEKLKEILAEAERRRKEERKRSTMARRRTEKMRAIRRTASVAW